MADFFNTMKAATCRIDAPGATGTGFLVSGNRIVTCHHVVERAGPGQTVPVMFSEREPSTAIYNGLSDPEHDVAVLEWQTPLNGIVPLQFAKAAERQCVWEGYGYPGLASGQGLPIDGVVDDLDGRDQRGRRSLVLTAKKLSAGLGSPPHGYSGAPVVVRGHVVGVLKRILEDKDFPRHVAFGTVYAARTEDFLDRLLLGEPFADTALVPEPAVPAAPPDGYEVFVSAVDADLPRASLIADALRKRELRVFFPLSDVAPGQEFATQISSALKRSRAALIVASRHWFQGATQEAQALWARRQESAFPLVPVLVEGASGELPAPWNSLRPIDLRDKDFQSPAFQRLLFALDGKAAPYDVVDKDIREIVKRANDPTTLLAHANRLISVGNPQKAVAMLPADSPDPQIRQVRALALAKSGNSDDAIEILEALQEEGRLDADTSGILAGRYRQKYQTTRQRSYLVRALETYRRVYEQSGDSYLGINTAAVLHQLGHKDEAVDVATKLIDSLKSTNDGPREYWPNAIRGEAWLIRGDSRTRANGIRESGEKRRDVRGPCCGHAARRATRIDGAWRGQARTRRPVRSAPAGGFRRSRHRSSGPAASAVPRAGGR